MDFVNVKSVNLDEEAGLSLRLPAVFTDTPRLENTYICLRPKAWHKGKEAWWELCYLVICIERKNGKFVPSSVGICMYPDIQVVGEGRRGSWANNIIGLIQLNWDIRDAKTLKIEYDVDCSLGENIYNFKQVEFVDLGTVTTGLPGFVGYSDR
ncbi:MAG: hypothetical protein ACKVS6_10045 [Planctomycetota bacterium]